MHPWSVSIQHVPQNTLLWSVTVCSRVVLLVALFSCVSSSNVSQLFSSSGDVSQEFHSHIHLKQLKQVFIYIFLFMSS